ncbi:hypothetical protein [Nocardia salmonicida]|uniref:hypothetical protein n=1 Tax=Nocardia salmonicida TaxID=53431 RepID=UPI0033CF63AB
MEPGRTRYGSWRLVEEEGDYWADEAPQENVVGRGEVVTTWADEHGQWDMALVRLDATA